MDIDLHVAHAQDLFLEPLEGVTEPEAKRKIIGNTFIDVFAEEARQLDDARFLAQGTLYPDVIESLSPIGGPSATIKSHHNVGGLPDDLQLRADRTRQGTVQGRGARTGPRAGAARPGWSTASPSRAPAWPYAFSATSPPNASACCSRPICACRKKC